jgi:hypothetical protein
MQVNFDKILFMLEQDTSISEETYQAYLMEGVEFALQSYFGRQSDSWVLNRFVGKMSTLSSEVHKDVVSWMTLSYNCGRFSAELKKCLLKLGIQTTMSSASNDKPEHVYLVPDNIPYDIIIDPTIGQFIMGYDTVFVGTRDQLKNIVINQTGTDKQYKLRNYAGITDSEELFTIMWGNNSVPISSPL